MSRCGCVFITAGPIASVGGPFSFRKDVVLHHVVCSTKSKALRSSSGSSLQRWGRLPRKIAAPIFPQTVMMIILLLFLQKQNLAFAVYLGVLHWESLTGFPLYVLYGRLKNLIVHPHLPGSAHIHACVCVCVCVWPKSNKTYPLQCPPGQTPPQQRHQSPCPVPTSLADDVEKKGSNDVKKKGSKKSGFFSDASDPTLQAPFPWICECPGGCKVPAPPAWASVLCGYIAFRHG